jgi:hypothetical protein
MDADVPIADMATCGEEDAKSVVPSGRGKKGEGGGGKKEAEEGGGGKKEGWDLASSTQLEALIRMTMPSHAPGSGELGITNWIEYYISSSIFGAHNVYSSASITCDNMVEMFVFVFTSWVSPIPCFTSEE